MIYKPDKITLKYSDISIVLFLTSLTFFNLKRFKPSYFLSLLSICDLYLDSWPLEMINGRGEQGDSDLQRSILAKNREIQQQILAVDTADDNLQR